MSIPLEFPYYEDERGYDKYLQFTNSFASWLSGGNISDEMYSCIRRSARMGTRAYNLDANFLPPINYFSIRKGEDLISFLPKGKEHQTNQDRSWKRDNRQTMKIGKWFRTLFKPEWLQEYGVTDKMIEQMTNKFKSWAKAENFTVKIYDNVEKVYDEDNCFEPGNWAQHSCMFNDFEYLELYKLHYCKGVALLNEDEEIVARAVLWHFDDGIKFMDRLYFHQDWMLDYMRDWAENNGYERLTSNTYACSESVKPDGSVYEHRYGLNIPSSYDYLPYMDTLRYIKRIDADTWRLTSHVRDGYSHELSCTDGCESTIAELKDEYIDTDLDDEVLERHVFTDVATGQTGDVRNACWVYDQNCDGVGRVHKDNLSEYVVCDYRGYQILRSSAVEVERLNTFYHENMDEDDLCEVITESGENFTAPINASGIRRCEHNDCYILRSESIYSSHYDSYIPSWLAIDIEKPHASYGEIIHRTTYVLKEDAEIIVAEALEYAKQVIEQNNKLRGRTNAEPKRKIDTSGRTSISEMLTEPERYRF